MRTAAKENILRYRRMYRSLQDPQAGGQYLTGALDLNVASQTPLDPSTFSSIVAIAGVSTNADISRLTTDQISSLIGAFDVAILRQEGVVATLKTDVARLETNINKVPDGLQANYDRANNNYMSTLREYNRLLAVYNYNQLTLSTKQGELRAMSTSVEAMTSTLAAYQMQYSTILIDISTKTVSLNEFDTEYHQRLDAYSTLKEQAATASQTVSTLSTTIVDIQSKLVSSSKVYTDAVSTYTSAYGDYVNYSTNIVSNASALYDQKKAAFQTTVDNRTLQVLSVLSASTNVLTAQGLVDAASTTKAYSDALQREIAANTAFLAAEARLDTANTAVAANPTDPALVSTQRGYTAELNTASSALAAAKQAREALAQTQLIQTMTANDTVVKSYDEYINSIMAEFYAAQQTEVQTMSTLSGLITQQSSVNRERDAALSTLQGISTIYISDLTEFQRASTLLGSIDTSSITLSTQIASTITAIQQYSTQIANYTMNAEEYRSTIAGNSAIQAAAKSTIDGYTLMRTQNTADISTLNGKIYLVNMSVAMTFSDLKSNVARYYQLKKDELLAEMDEYRYATQELNSYLGYVAADLLIRRLNLYSEIDGIMYQLQNTTDPTTKTQLTTRVNQIRTTQDFIQGLIDRLNPLEIEFANLITILQNERTQRGVLLDKRKELTDIELQVKETPTVRDSVYPTYTARWAEFENARTTINGEIAKRTTSLSKIYQVLDPLLPNILTVNAGYIFPAKIVMVSTPIPFQAMVPGQSVVPIYGIMPPI